MGQESKTVKNAKFVDLYELMQIDMNVDSETLRKRIQQLYLEAQQNLDHRNAEKRLHFQQVFEVYMPQARYLLLDSARRAEYNRYLSAFRFGETLEPVSESVAPVEIPDTTDITVSEDDVMPSMTPEGELEAQQAAEHRSDLWDQWKQEIESELEKSRKELLQQKARNTRLMWGAGLAVLACGLTALMVSRNQTAAIVTTRTVIAKPVFAPNNLVVNPDMTHLDQNSKAPTAWSEFWSEYGKMAATHDTKVFRSAPASLCLGSVQNKQGKLKGQVSQSVPVQAGERVRLKTYLKTAGNAQVQVALQPRKADTTPVDFYSALWVPSAIDWQLIDKEFTMPPKTESVAVVLFLEGKGRAWMDDVEVTVVKDNKKS